MNSDIKTPQLSAKLAAGRGVLEGKPGNVAYWEQALAEMKQITQTIVAEGCCNSEGPDDRPGREGMCRKGPGMCSLYLKCMDLVNG